MKPFSILIFVLLLLNSCEPPTIRERFTHAMIHPDGKAGLFVFKREHYYPGQMGIFTRTPDKYVVNVSIIGSYDLSSGKVRVLHRRDNGSQYRDGANDFHISQVFGSRALIGGRDAHYNWLDIDTGVMTPLRLDQEMAERGRGVGHIYLVDEKGTLILDNTALSGAMNSASRQLWVRRSNGEYERIVERPAGSASSHGFQNNELYFFADKKCQIYNLDTRTTRLCKDQNQAMPRMNPDLTIDFRADYHGSPQPTIGRKVGGQWIREEARIDTSELR